MTPRFHLWRRSIIFIAGMGLMSLIDSLVHGEPVEVVFVSFLLAAMWWTEEMRIDRVHRT